MTKLHFYARFYGPMLNPVCSGPHSGLKLLRHQLVTPEGLVVAELVKDEREKDGPLWWKVHHTSVGFYDTRWLFEEAEIGVGCNPPWVK